MAGLLWPTAATAAVPEQEPGVTLRVFDLQTSLNELCTLKTGQTPNVDKLMSTIDWSTSADFGYDDRFAAQVLGNVNIATAGDYTFRLISDDGSRLKIDDATVINHDGLHAATEKDGTVNLTTGYHSLKIDYFERDANQRLTLQWKTPGSSSFVLVPQSVLSTDAGVVRVTAPGKKECEGSSDTAGDGLPLTDVHPSFTLTDLRPSGFQPTVTGLDWFSDGRMALSTWGGTDANAGEVWILDNVQGSTSASQVTRTRFASGLKEPMGLKIVDGKIYVSEKHRLTELNDTNSDGVSDDARTVATWPYDGNFHEFAFGLLYKDGHFYLNLSVSINYGGATTNPQGSVNRGTTIKVNKATGDVSYVASGLRTPHGIGWGPEDSVLVTDNQGDWLPASKLVHVKQGRFFNHKTNPAGPFDTAPVTAPVLWMPQNEIANSPSTPVLMTEGPFAGQLAIGDVTYGGLQRAYLEKVNGDYQGALFRMTQGLEAGISEVSVGPDGDLYVGGLGGGGNWEQAGKLKYGLQKLTYNNTSTFDILAMRAVAGGFEFEYTQPLSTATIDDIASRYKVKQWGYEPTSSYGGPKKNEETLTVTSATVSADRKKVTVKINGLKADRVVHVRSPRPFSSDSNKSLWSTEAWYTLNSLVGTTSTDRQYEAEDAALSGGAGKNTDHTGYTGSGFVDGYGTSGATTTFTVNAAAAGTHQAKLRYSNGPYPTARAKTISLYVNNSKVKQINLASTANWDTWATHTESVTLNAGNNTIAYKVDTGDYGHVNLDNLTVTGPPASAQYEAEDAALSGGAGKNTDHTGYTGSGFVDGYGTSGATTTFTVNAAAAGTHQAKLRYSNGPYPTARAKTISLYVNNSKVKQINLASTANWDTWATHTESVTLNAGNNTIAYKVDTGDYGYVNLDNLTVTSGSDGDTTNRIALFDGTDLSKWEKTDDSAATWPVADGSMESLGGDIRTKDNFTDFKLHVEFNIPNLPSTVTGQQRGNSGVYLQGRYEIQVLDSYGDTTPADNEAGGIYSKRAPDSNAATAPGTWQTYDITFTAARYDASGTKTANARATVVWNGVTVHNNVEINGATGGGIAEGATPGPIMLQDHGDPGENVRYRNIWIEPVA
jgi:hypothetical protein